ncbi:hypothetical protein CRG98_034388 [Punica granatum]|uniref:Uncharacterized protein n=1 Tax=Punica granatum TaxID=22663 RepID=A0A2I0INF0_PUNGR|nr:hypothetical protein CRG98_034388 [Punica granatum]
MASGDSFPRASVARPWEDGHSQAALHRCVHACPDEMKFGCAQRGNTTQPRKRRQFTPLSVLQAAKSDARVRASLRTRLGPFPYTSTWEVSDDELPPTKPKMQTIKRITQHRQNRLPQSSIGFNSVHPLYGPKCALIGACMRAIISCGLGVSTFPGMCDGHA